MENIVHAYSSHVHGNPVMIYLAFQDIEPSLMGSFQPQGPSYQNVLMNAG